MIIREKYSKKLNTIILHTDYYTYLRTHTFTMSLLVLTINKTDYYPEEPHSNLVFTSDYYYNKKKERK